jgi:hypothetical protein
MADEDVALYGGRMRERPHPLKLGIGQLGASVSIGRSASAAVVGKHLAFMVSCQDLPAGIHQELCRLEWQQWAGNVVSQANDFVYSAEADVSSDSFKGRKVSVDIRE